jgi:hypothetical protein
MSLAVFGMGGEATTRARDDVADRVAAAQVFRKLDDPTARLVRSRPLDVRPVVDHQATLDRSPELAEPAQLPGLSEQSTPAEEAGQGMLRSGRGR